MTATVRRAILVMFDSLNRAYLPPYGGETVAAPNTERLAAHTVRFDQCYAGSLPCMPARRELHTGRYNFLHRGWGPLEPFDDSVPAMLTAAGVTTHLATDHMHYWEDGGATYHTRYGTCSLVRGQQGDPWKGRVVDPAVDPDLRIRRSGTWRQDRVNRPFMPDLPAHPQTRTFDAGLEFLRDNADQVGWMLQIETFDPHEPFHAADEFRRRYVPARAPEDGDYDWPDYQQVTEDPAVAERVRQHYRALVAQCDASLGRVLDAMDDYGLWEDTALIVCTDHGFLLGEQGWWGKSVPPWYDQTAHTPLFVWDPRSPHRAGTSSDRIVQTIDIGPTLLDWFDVPATERMQGTSLSAGLRDVDDGRDYALFGAFGGHVNLTDGRWVYMRAPADPGNMPLHEYTLMPTRMRGFFTNTELATATLHDGFPFTQGVPVLQVEAVVFGDPHQSGTMLFDRATDPEQQHPVIDDEVELRMATALRDLLIASEAPPEQFERLGLPPTGALQSHHLLARAQEGQVRAARAAPDPVESFPHGRWSVTDTVADILADEAAAAVLRAHAGDVRIAAFGQVFSGATLYRAAAALFGPLPWPTLRLVAEELSTLSR